MVELRNKLSLLKTLAWLLPLSSLSFLVSCSTTPPDAPWCLDLTDNSKIPATPLGWCDTMVTGKKYYVNDTDKPFYESDGTPRTWSYIMETGFIAPASTVAQLKTYIDTQCREHKNCPAPVKGFLREVTRAEEVKKQRDLLRTRPE